MIRRNFLLASLWTTGLTAQNPPRPNLKKWHKADIFSKIAVMIVEQVGVKLKDVKERARLEMDLEVDSLDLVELVMAFERTFEMGIVDEDACKFVTVGDVFRYIQGRLKAQRRLLR